MNYDLMYCPNCCRESPILIIEKDETYSVMDIEDITINASVCVCNICKREIWHNDFDGKNLMKAYRIFAEKHPEIDFPAKKYL